MAGSRETTNSKPQMLMFSSCSATPRLNRLAATLLGMAMKSALPSTAMARSWSGSFQGKNSTCSATSLSRPASTMWISALLTEALGPASSSLGNLAPAGGVWARSQGAPRAALPSRPAFSRVRRVVCII